MFISSAMSAVVTCGSPSALPSASAISRIRSLVRRGGYDKDAVDAHLPRIGLNVGFLCGLVLAFGLFFFLPTFLIAFSALVFVMVVEVATYLLLRHQKVGLQDLKEQFRQWRASKGSKKILLNLGDVNYIDSSGIGELVSAFTTVRNQGGELKLLNLTKKVHDLLQITKLYTVFDVKDDETTAVKSFTK